jgi:hypothetical protein
MLYEKIWQPCRKVKNAKICLRILGSTHIVFTQSRTSRPSRLPLADVRILSYILFSPKFLILQKQMSRLYDYKYKRFLPIIDKNLMFLRKTNVMIHFLHNLAVFGSNMPFVDILKNHNTGPSYLVDSNYTYTAICEPIEEKSTFFCPKEVNTAKNSNHSQ